MCQGVCQECARCDIATVLSLAGQGPLCPSELQSQADPLHVAMTRRERLGATENEIGPGEPGVAYTPPQRELKAAATERRIGSRVRQIANAVADIESRGSGRSPVHAREIERPSRLLQPGPDVALKLGMILLGDAPTSDVSV